MRSRAFWLGTILLLACALALPQSADANGGGSGRGGRHDRKHFKHVRYYPSNYYFKKKVHFHPKKRFFFYPRRKYYHYYDFYPQKIYYYGGEREIIGTNPNYLSITSIANMASQGIPDAVIIEEIERSGSRYKLNDEILRYLEQNGVSEDVITCMKKTRR